MRISRAMKTTTKEKISRRLSGRRKSSLVKKRISEGMKRYWATIPYDENKK